MQKVFIFSLFSFALFCCTTKQNLEGYWYGKFNDSDDYYSLVYFNDKIFIDFFGFNSDTVSYFNIGHKYYFYGDSFHDLFNYTIKATDKELKFYRGDSLFSHLKKSEKSHYIFDCISLDSGMNLPVGKGKISTLGNFNRLSQKLIVNYVGGELIIQINDTLILFDDFFYKRLEWEEEFPISIIAERSIPTLKFENLLEQLKLAGYRDLVYVLKHDVYHQLNTIAIRISSLNERQRIKYQNDSIALAKLPPPPPSIGIDEISKHAIIIKMVDGAMEINFQESDVHQLKRILDHKVNIDSLAFIGYYFDRKATFQDYITILTVTRNIYNDLKDEFLINKHGTCEREELTNDDYFWEAQNKYAWRLLKMDSIEYETLKMQKRGN